MRPSAFQAAALLVASASALVIPPKPNLSPFPSIGDVAVAGSTASNGISIYFSTSCPGCFSDPAEELDIELKVDSSLTACHAPAVVLNNVRLAPLQSSIHFKANTTNTSSAQEVAASWAFYCVDSEVSILTLNIDAILGQTSTQPGNGFSVSFKQGRSPEFLRLEHVPIDNEDPSSDLQRFTQLQEDLEVIVVSTPNIVDAEIPTELQEQLRQLYEIKAQIGRLHFKYMRQERHIFGMIKQDFYSCHGPTCLFQTAIKKAPDFFELVKAHFKHRPDWSKLHRPGLDGQARRMGFHKQDNVPPMDDFLEIFNDELESPSPMEDVVPQHTPFPVPFDEPHRGGLPPPPFPPPGDEEDFPPPPPWHHGGPPPPPPPPPPEEHRHHIGPTWTHGPPSPWATHHRGPHHRPHFMHRHGPHHHPFFFSLGSILFFVVVASLAFKCVRTKTGLFRNDRCQRDCRARREECRNRAAYRRAAIRHRWQRWWSQFRQPESTADYEEKRARILNQEDALEDVMQSEIQDLRRAHELVGDMVRAEETRQRLNLEANFSGASSSSPQQIQGLQRQDTTHSEATQATLPLYQPPPPSYDQELEGEMTVVDGFSYTPSATDSTPDSSVVDCSPRMSFETSTTVTKA